MLFAKNSFVHLFIKKLVCTILLTKNSFEQCCLQRIRLYNIVYKGFVCILLLIKKSLYNNKRIRLYNIVYK